MPAQPAIGVGDVAPDFTLPSATGEMVNLSSFRGKSEVVLFFYPKDNTPGCTAEALAFRDSYEAFKEAGAEVIGISSDSEHSHRGFAQRLGLKFLLLSDTKGEVRARVWSCADAGSAPRSGHVPDRPGRRGPACLFVAIANEQTRAGNAGQNVQAIRRLSPMRGGMCVSRPAPRAALAGAVDAAPAGRP